MVALGPALSVTMCASGVPHLERFGVPAAAVPDRDRGRLRVAALIAVEGKSIVWAAVVRARTGNNKAVRKSRMTFRFANQNGQVQGVPQATVPQSPKGHSH